MNPLAAIMLLLEIFSKAGGPEELKKFFSRHKDELEALRLSLKDAPTPKDG